MSNAMSVPISIDQGNAVVRLCEHAAATMRSIIDLTSPMACQIEHPSEAFRAVAALRLLTERLPLALAHLAVWFCEQVDLQAVTMDAGSAYEGDPHGAAAELRTALVDEAIPLLAELAVLLDRAAHALAYATSAQPYQ